MPGIEHTMPEVTSSAPKQLIRDVAILQIKLLVDGLRDAVLIPVSLLAGFLGLVRGGADAHREFRRVLKWGRRSERWINLFGDHVPLGRRSHVASSLDLLLDRVEAAVMEQYGSGHNTEEARAAIKAALDGAPAGTSPAEVEK
jgi:hypothetical protein